MPPAVPVIVIDDQEDIGEVIRRLLRKRDDLRFAGWLPSPEGLDTFLERERADGYDGQIVIVMDYNIPGFDAEKVVRGIRARTPNANVVVFSGDVTCRDVMVSAGAAAWVGKDESPQALIEAAVTCIDPG